MGNLFDDFGKHIVSLSEELSKLRQFKTYMNRSAVMAEGLKGYMDLVNERLDTIKTEVLKLQRAGHYAETIKDFWRMVWETGSRVIIMTTAFKENGRDKCERYWPEKINKDVELMKNALSKAFLNSDG